jgi:hypothetical protein
VTIDSKGDWFGYFWNIISRLMEILFLIVKNDGISLLSLVGEILIIIIYSRFPFYLANIYLFLLNIINFEFWFIYIINVRIGPWGDLLLVWGLWMKSFVGTGSLWKLDWSNDWLTLLTDHLTNEGGRVLIPILVIGELRFLMS